MDIGHLQQQSKVKWKLVCPFCWINKNWIVVSTLYAKIKSLFSNICLHQLGLHVYVTCMLHSHQTYNPLISLYSATWMCIFVVAKFVFTQFNVQVPVKTKILGIRDCDMWCDLSLTICFLRCPRYCALPASCALWRVVVMVKLASAWVLTHAVHNSYFTCK